MGIGKYLTKVRKLDIFGQPIGFRVQKEKTFQTYVGLLFTAVYALVMLLVVTQETIKFVDTTQPISVGESYSTETYPRIDMLANKLLPVVIGYSSEVDFIPTADIDRYFTIVA